MFILRNSNTAYINLAGDDIRHYDGLQFLQFLNLLPQAFHFSINSSLHSSYFLYYLNLLFI